MMKMKKKIHDSYPILFSFLRMCANFYHNRTNNEVFLGPVPLRMILMASQEPGLLDKSNTTSRFLYDTAFMALIFQSNQAV